jgi:pyruvate kinase
METIKTKIIATIGPATLSPQVFQQLVDTGIDYIRINTSYGDTTQYDQILDNLKNSNAAHIQVIYDLKQIEKLDYAIEHDIAHIAVSFVENADSINKVRGFIPDAFIIAKIESEVGVRNFNNILSVSDGIMVARGDLGKAVSLEKVPPLQKEFTQKTLENGKFLVTATEMLLSMTDNPQPTRAEVSDVANAVFDHSSAVMLSEETAIGKYPVEAVAMMRRIITEAEAWNNSR